MRLRDILGSVDWIIIGCCLLLIMIGLAMLLSATYDQQPLSGLFVRQILAAGLGLTLMAAIVKIPYHVWSRWTGFLYGAGLVGLLAVTILGSVIRGTVSRLEFFGFQIQPSEFMKVALLVSLAWLLCRYKRLTWKEIAISGLIVAIPVALIMREPDLGMASLMLMLWAGLIVFIGVPWRYISALALLAALLAAGAWQWALLDYQKDRILTFLNPAQDPLRSGYNVNQSMIALGSGRLWGRGLGHGPQSQLQFLPEQHTDFIFASIGEELGLVGIALVLAMYLVLLWRILIIAQHTTDKFGQLLCIGLFCLLLASLLVSAGMNMGLLPVTGIPLPLVSYGGSNLLVTMVLVGLAESVRVHSQFRQVGPIEISGIS